ncbi:MAG: phenylalanine--tRNA ligase subunit beta [Rhodospirillales bacterium]|nr:phenylalanine--tRNA ligase subunit beta [Rhodospirillales bacterium]
MKFTLNWLKDHLDTDADLQKVVDTLTMIGLEVEGVEDRTKGLESFVVAEVLEADKHPDADKLKVCTVSNGSETFQVVCGAPNARKGMKAVFATEGTYIPGLDVTLKKAKIRGVESSGMMLSEREMNLSDEHDGIVDLPADAEVGAQAIKVMGIDDPVIEIAITPNRGDCLGVRGVARDLAAAGIGTLRALNSDKAGGSFESPIKVHLDFDEATKDACPYFVGRYVRGVKNCESPQWLKDRLLAIGLRPISALVDITNLVTFDLGRPLHVFDVARLTGDIHVRLAKDGEKILALDGKEYELDSEMTVIADEKEAEAIAGVMGGEISGCTDDTTDVFIESAYFDPIRTAITGRKLNLQSDARFRFERGVDPVFTYDGAEIATHLVMELCGGEPSEIVVAGAAPDIRNKLTLRAGRVEQITGVKVPADEIVRILEVVGCEVVRNGNDFDVLTPSWRPDIVAGLEGEAGLVEEVVRLYGYAHIPATPLERETDLPVQALTPIQKNRSTARRMLAQRGLIESVTYSFLPMEQAKMFGGGADAVCLVNPISTDLNVMRPSILPNLIVACGKNDDHDNPNACLFEVGPEYHGDGPKDQRTVATGVRSGKTGDRNWAQQPRNVDAFDAKADALAVLESIGAPTGNLQVFTDDIPAWYHPGRAGSLRLGPKNILAWFGEIHPGILKQLGVKGPIVGFEIYLENLPKAKPKKTTKPLLKIAQFHTVERDFAFVIGKDVTAEQVVRAAKGADKTLITKVGVFDLFEGASLGEDKKSIAINVTLQPTERTLKDDEIEAIAQKVIGKVVGATGGELRG